MSSPLPTYTNMQLMHYFDHIFLPESHRIYDINKPALTPAEQLSFLALLQKLTLVTVPFENLSIHYSPSHHVDINPEALYEKIVTRDLREEANLTGISAAGKRVAVSTEQLPHVMREYDSIWPRASLAPRTYKGGRGGYCMENNRFFATILHSLGFDVYSVGARVHTPDGYNGWSHMVNLVKIDNMTFAVDIGFGGGGPTCPLSLPDLERGTEPPLSIALGRILHHSGSSSEVRLRKRPLSEEPLARRGTDRDQALWVYETCHDPRTSKPIWEPRYAFAETEFLPNDFVMMNYYTSTSPQIWFTQKIVCARYLLEGDLGDLESQDKHPAKEVPLVKRGIVGQITMEGGVVKRTYYGASRVMEVCETEAERVEALDKWFGIKLTSGEKAGIKGLVTELHGGATRKRPRSEDGQ